MSKQKNQEHKLGNILKKRLLILADWWNQVLAGLWGGDLNFSEEYQNGTSFCREWVQQITQWKCATCVLKLFNGNN